MASTNSPDSYGDDDDCVGSGDDEDAEEEEENDDDDDDCALIIIFIALRIMNCCSSYCLYITLVSADMILYYRDCYSFNTLIVMFVASIISIIPN